MLHSHKCLICTSFAFFDQKYKSFKFSFLWDCGRHIFHPMKHSFNLFVIRNLRLMINLFELAWWNNPIKTIGIANTELILLDYSQLGCTRYFVHFRLRRLQTSLTKIWRWLQTVIICSITLIFVTKTDISLLRRVILANKTFLWRTTISFLFYQRRIEVVCHVC